MNLAKLIKVLAGGTIFSCTFIKRTTGEKRRMRCRLGVRKYLKPDGRGLGYSAEDKQLLTVYDIEKKGYRSIPLDNLIDIKIRKVTYQPKQLESAIELFGIGEKNNG